jgi:hypothetical protein
MLRQGSSGLSELLQGGPLFRPEERVARARFLEAKMLSSIFQCIFCFREGVQKLIVYFAILDIQKLHLNPMDKKRRRSIVALLLVLTIGNYFRIHGNEEVRPILFLSIFLIGAWSGILISDFVELFRSKKSDKDKMI